MKMRKYATVAVVLLGVPWLLTGGCVGFECKYRIVEPYDKQNRPLILVNVANKYRTIGVPFLFTYTDSPPPYDAEFTYMTQNVVEGATLTIRKLLIRYGDGKEVDLTDQVEKSIAAEPYEMWYVEDHVQMRKPSLQAKFTIRNCVEQEGKFALLLAGELRQGRRVLESFDTSLRCEPFGQTDFYPTWYWWLISQA